MTGTWVNIATVVVGSLLGMAFGAKLPERFRKIVFQGIGLFTLLLGFMMAMKTREPLVLVLSMVGGGLLGEWWKIDQLTEKAGERLKSVLRSKNVRFTEGLLTAFLLFCMGSMTILGALEEGLGKDPDLLITKSIMDGFSSVVLAAGMGIGVLFSIVPLLIYQGGLTLLAGHVEPWLSDSMVAEMTATGGLMLIGLGITILEVRKLKVINFTPGLILAVVFTWVAENVSFW